jgi:hypothetical protein
MGLEHDTYSEVVERDGGRCVVCGKRQVEVHEIVPRSALPGEANENLLFSLRNRCVLCRNCHGNVHTVWGRVMLLGLLSLRHNYRYHDEPFAKYFRVRAI